MDDRADATEADCFSMIESSGITDLSELTEISEATGLSPLTSSLDHQLSLREDNLSPTRGPNMGIENTWTEANGSDYAIPLPPPPSFEDLADMGGDNPVGEGGASTGSGGTGLGTFLPPNNLFNDTADTRDDSVIEVTTPAGVCGLRNLGNTCFMAAGLQCLTATPPVLRHFLELHQRAEKLPPPGSIMAHFGSLLGKMWSGRYSVVRPTEFKQTLGAYHSQFKDYRQHDCQEFLALLLDSLHEQMNTAKCAKPCRVSSSSATTTRNATTTTTAAESIDSRKNIIAVAGRNVNLIESGETIVTPSIDSTLDELMDTYDHSTLPECPNSPNIAVAGSPRGLDSPIRELDSTANSPRGSLLNDDDDETLDSDEIMDAKSSFSIVKSQQDNFSKFIKDELSKKSSHLDGLYDILKDAKTSNANFLVTPQECNNEIHFDSQKFPKDHVRRMALDNSNLTENHDFDSKNLGTKRMKTINVGKNHCSPDCISSGSDTECDSGLEKCNVKRMRLEEHETKNHRCDGLGTSGVGVGGGGGGGGGGIVQCSRYSVQNGDCGAIAAQHEVEADKHWANHLRSNRSVIVDTFQGQFKSTVVCEVCKHVSITYEPFMYLSVPLPNAMERQLSVTYIPANNDPPVKCVVSLNKQSRIGKLKDILLKTLAKEIVPPNNVALAEVLENHIARILDDNLLLRYVNETNRSIYAFELSDPPDAYSWIADGGGDRSIIDSTDETDCHNGTSGTATGVGEEIAPCTICLEELDGDLKRHGENDCTLIMCDSCIENYFKSSTEPHVCPLCTTSVVASSFTKIDQTGRPRPKIRILNVPIVLRHDTNEATNNRKGTKLFGNPRLVKLPSRVNAKDLHAAVKRVVPQEESYTVHFVTGQGHLCSRCMYTMHCTGCSVPESGTIVFQSGDTLAVRYTIDVPTVVPPIEHTSLSKERPHHPLSLYDCLQAFSQSETLDEHNPWFCPKCERNQCATKTLTVHRYPKFLIVYLKRFVFYECVGMKLDDKVTFPLAGLSVGRHHYDLYACVCHFGGVSAGHYTAYAKNPRTELWHYYNDESTSRQKPQEEDYSNAYILFYCRQGSNSKPCNI